MHPSPSAGRWRRQIAPAMFAAFTFAAAYSLLACDKKADYTSQLSLLAGGETTVFSESSHAFSFPLANLDPSQSGQFFAGDVAFEAVFVTSPNITNPGLGPAFITASCEACHARDGRGAPPGPGEEPVSLLFRASVPGMDANGGPAPVPGFGGQIQTRAIGGFTAEAKVQVSYTEVAGTYGDGIAYALLQPTYTVMNPYTTWPPDAMISPRIGPPVFGLGLIEAIDDATILAAADPADADGNGISGRANMVFDATTATTRIGRFGWKANVATLQEQVAGAYRHDMGITSPLFPAETTAGQVGFDDGQADDPEIDQATLDATRFYVQTLAVPARRISDLARVTRGEELFMQIGCASCHTPTLVTGNSHPIVELRNQRIHLFSDLLLHDMGDGLADGRPDFAADGREWRTAPLWGVGLTQRINGHTRFLHDGRARNLAEAILWHGGEAEAAKEAFRLMLATDREALLAFLNAN